MKFKTGLLRALLALGATILTLPVVADSMLDEARALLDKGQAQRAFQLLSKSEDQRAGDPNFDYLLGISALDSGQAGLAVFALERVVAMQPENAQARAELARAYFELRDNSAAKQEFENVRESTPPAAVSAAVDKYLSALQARFDSQNSMSVNGYIAFTGGYDSNINSATSSDIIAVPALGNIQVTLNNAAKKQSEGFGSGEIGLSVAKRLAPNWTAFGGAKGLMRFNRNDSQFETSSADVNGGMRIRDGATAYTAIGQWQRYYVGRDPYRRTAGGTVQIQRTLSPNTQVTGFAQVAFLHYMQDAQEIRDSRISTFGLAAAHSFATPGDPTVFASAYGAREHNRADVDHLGRTFFGARLGGQVSLRGNLDAVAGVSIQKSDYGGQEPLFLKGRVDRFAEASAELRYSPLRDVTLIPKVTYTVNDSNITLNDYKRWLVAGTVRMDF